MQREYLKNIKSPNMRSIESIQIAQQIAVIGDLEEIFLIVEHVPVVGKNKVWSMFFLSV